MKLQTSLNAWLNKIRPGNAQYEEGDGKMVLANQLNHAGRFPFPYTKTLSSVQTLPAGEDVQGSFAGYRLDPIGTALALDWITIPPGVWDINLSYFLKPVGAVSDITAVATCMLQIIDGPATRIAILAELAGDLARFQSHNRTFTVSVSKDIVTQIRLQHAVGLGTALSVAEASILANRII
jgi:hypothetical protein